MAVREPKPDTGTIKETGWSVWPTWESWTWPGREGKDLDVEVYSKCPSVRLYLNDNLIGEKTCTVTEEYKASLNGAPTSTGTRLHNAFVTGYHSVVENVIGLVAWLLEAGPRLLLWAALLFFPVLWAWRRARRSFTSQQKGAAA